MLTDVDFRTPPFPTAIAVIDFRPRKDRSTTTARVQGVPPLAIPRRRTDWYSHDDTMHSIGGEFSTLYGLHLPCDSSTHLSLANYVPKSKASTKNLVEKRKMIQDSGSTERKLRTPDNRFYCNPSLIAMFYDRAQSRARRVKQAHLSGP